MEEIKTESEIKLDLGCGRNKQAGFTGVDFYCDEADIKHDLFTFPYPFADDSVSEIFCSHFLHQYQSRQLPPQQPTTLL